MAGEIDKFIASINSRYIDRSSGKPAPLWENKLTYDTTVSTLEPLYYWLIDYLGLYDTLEKVSDTFTASPGSPYFADLGARATKMQEEGMKIMGTVNIVVKSIINLIYDLKNFDIRLKQYERAKSDNPAEKEAGILGLKELWMSSVDMQRGNGSINYMTQGYGFTTLRPAFLAAKSLDDVDKMDLNEIVKRVLKPRVGEFFEWVKISEAELRKRYEIEKSYLKNQIDTMKLYSTWVKPYLQAAEQLRMKESAEPALVSVFGRMILELSLFATKKIDVRENVISKDLPPEFEKRIGKLRDFYQILTVDFKFSAYQTPQAHHAGRVDISFKAYVLNGDEMLILNKLRADSMKDSMLNLAKNLSDESLKQLKEDISYFTEVKKDKKEEEESIFGDLYKDFKKAFYGQTRAEKEEEEKKEKEEKEKEDKEHLDELWDNGVPDDSHEEGVVRQLTELESSKSCFSAFDTFKKAQGLASFPNPFDEPDAYKRIRARISEVKAALAKK